MSVRCLLSLVIASIVAVSGAPEFKIKIGGDVSFKSTPPLSSGSTITWKFRDPKGVVIRVMEFDYDDIGTPQNPLFKDFASANKKTGELTLSKLTEDHSGVYFFELNGKEQQEKFPLKVMGVVQKPEITPEKTTSNPDVVYLKCNYDKVVDKDAKISWSCSNDTTEQLVYKKTGKLDPCCACTLKNDVSEETSDQICKSDLFHEGSNIAGTVVPVLVFILFVFLVLVLMYLFYNKFHDYVFKKYEKTPCLGVILTLLNHCRIGKKTDFKQTEVTTDDLLADLQHDYEETQPGDRKTDEENGTSLNKEDNTPTEHSDHL